MPYPRVPRPIKNSKGLNNLKFATTDKAGCLGFGFSDFQKRQWNDIPFWAQSAFDCAEEVPQAPKHTESKLVGRLGDSFGTVRG